MQSFQSCVSDDALNIVTFLEAHEIIRFRPAAGGLTWIDNTLSQTSCSHFAIARFQGQIAERLTTSLPLRFPSPEAGMVSNR